MRLAAKYAQQVDGQLRKMHADSFWHLCGLTAYPDASSIHKPCWLLNTHRISNCLQSAAGALAELGTTLGQNMAEYVPKMMPILFRELRCDDPGNRRNAAFCAGVFCQYCPQQMQNHIGQLLQVQTLQLFHVYFNMTFAVTVKVQRPR